MTCCGGLPRSLVVVRRCDEAALADNRDRWSVFSDYMRRLVDADTSSLRLVLVGMFEPTPEMFTFAPTGFSGSCWRGSSARLRPGIDVHGVSPVFPIVAAIKLSDRSRTEQLTRHVSSCDPGWARRAARNRVPGPPLHGSRSAPGGRYEHCRDLVISITTCGPLALSFKPGTISGTTRASTEGGCS